MKIGTKVKCILKDNQGWHDRQGEYPPGVIRQVPLRGKVYTIRSIRDGKGVTINEQGETIEEPQSFFVHLEEVRNPACLSDLGNNNSELQEEAWSIMAFTPIED